MGDGVVCACEKGVWKVVVSTDFGWFLAFIHTLCIVHIVSVCVCAESVLGKLCVPACAVRKVVFLKFGIK